MAVGFSGGSHYTRSSGGLPNGDLFTVTCWVYIGTDRNTWTAAWALDTGDTSDYIYLETDSDGTTWKMWDRNSGTAKITGPNATVGSWYFFAFSRSSSTDGTLYWSQNLGTLSSGSSTTFSSLPPTRLVLAESPWGSEYLDGRLAAVKVWSGVALSQAEVLQERAQIVPARVTSLHEWHPFLQAETTDHSGSGRSLTATGGTPTTEAGPPIPWTRAIVLRPARPTGGGTAATVTPAVIATTTAVPSASVQASSTATPAVIAAVASVPAATAQASSTATPSTVTTTASVPAATAQASSTVTPSTVATTTAVPAATSQASSTVTPAVIAAIGALPAATAVTGTSATVTPSVVTTTAAVPAATAQASSTATPAVIAAVAALPAATALTGSDVTVTPAVIATTASVPSASVQASSTATPAVIAAVAALPASTTATTATITPAAITVAAATPAATVAADATVAAAVLAATVSVPLVAQAGQAVPDLNPVDITVRERTAAAHREATTADIRDRTSATFRQS